MVGRTRDTLASIRDRHVLTGGLVWVALASGFTGFGGLQVYPPPFPQVVLASLVVLLILVFVFSRGFRNWVEGLPTSVLVALHGSRFVGVYFLFLYARGELPYAFAVLGGWGDIGIAAVAMVLLVAYRGAPPARSAAVQLWNTAGLADILFVVGAAGRSALDAPESMEPITRLPLGLLPTFLVPLIIFSHLVLARRGLRSRVQRENDGARPR